MADIKSALQQALTSAATNAAVARAIDEWKSDDTNTAAPAPDPLPTIQEATTMTNQYADLTISEQTFNFIRDTPYVLLPQAIKQLATRGHNVYTTSSLISQMIRKGMISRDKDGKLTALQKKYTPIQSVKSRAYLAAVSKRNGKAAKMLWGVHVPAAVEAQVTHTKGIAALNSTPLTTQAQPTVVAPAPKPLTAAQVLESLSIKEAHILYRELQTMFG